MLVTVSISLAALIALAGLLQFAATRGDARTFPPPGRLLDIDGRKLHARVEGRGAPTVIFESGISASSINWLKTQPAVAAFTTTCCYDRAGLGWSDPAPTPYSVDAMLSDLSAVLDNLPLHGPCLLVGHSYGGLLVRLFAERHPEKVAGLVLVDPVLAYSWANPDPAHARTKRRAFQIARWGAWLATFGVVRLVTSRALVQSLVVPKLGGLGIVRRLQTELAKLPAEVIPLIRSHWCRPRNFRSMTAHLAALNDCFAALQNSAVTCPITVISAADTPPGGLLEHQAIAALSARGRHIVAKGSGHWIHLDEPQLVIDAIRSLCGSW